MPLKSSSTKSGNKFLKTSPVNVYVKRKSKKNGDIISTHQEKIKKKTCNPKNSPVMVKRPFIPPPGKTSPGRPLSWESKSHRLEFIPPTSTTRSMHINDLSSSEEDAVHDSTRRFEKNIDKLLQDVSLSERRFVVDRAEEQLNASRRLIEDQENEIKEYRRDLNTTARDYDNLRRSFEFMNKEVSRTKTQAEILESEKESLHAKLMAVEREGIQASREVEKLRESCRRLKQDKQMTLGDVDILSRQRDKLLEKLDEFEATNIELRRLLRKAQERQALEQRTVDRCEILMRKLTEAEAKIEDQAVQLVDQDKKIDILIAQVDADKHQAKSFADSKKSLESNRAHLQKELRSKEGENSRLSLHCQKLEQEINTRSLEIEHLQGLIAATRDKSLKDKDALKRATRIQRERAQRQEEINNELQRQVNSLLADIDNAKFSLKELTDAHVKLKQDNEFLEDESKVLRKHILEIGNVLEFTPKTMKSGAIYVAEKLVSKVRLLKSVKNENETVKTDLRSAEANLDALEKESASKLRHADAENVKLRHAIDQYESLTSEYKQQLERHRKDNDEFRDRIQKLNEEMKTKAQASMVEVVEVRTALQNKIKELEPYPELLKAAEIRLQDSTVRAEKAEKRIEDHTRLIAELTQKIELQTEQLDHLREKYRKRSEENKDAEQQLNSLERRSREADSSQRELILSISRKDEQIHTLQERLDDQRMENEKYINQLEIAVSDAKKQAESQKEKSIAKERAAQARIMDLEGQVSRSTQNTQILKRSKEEAERKFNSRLQDMRDRLEQANSTTRSMQNYVQFLKSTYANVFSDDLDSDKITAMPF